MLPEQARVQDTRDWLKFAGRDLRAAEHDLKDGPELNRDVMFHCQQAVEKAGDLTQYAWRLRYPGAPYEPGQEEIQRALASARETLEGILDRLPEETRP